MDQRGQWGILCHTAEGSCQDWVATGCVVSDLSRIIVAEVDEPVDSSSENNEKERLEKLSAQGGNGRRRTAL